MCAQIVPKWLSQNPPIIPFDAYMSLALYHPKYGYYAQEKSPITRDFQTASTLSSHLGQMLAMSIYSSFKPPFNLTEIGPGTGDLMCAVLTKLQFLKNMPDQVYLHDLCHHRLNQSHAKVTARFPNTKIHKMKSLPSKWTGALIANEVLDAMPFKRYYHDGKDNFEMLVDTQKMQWVYEICHREAPRKGPYFYEISDYDPINPWLKSCQDGMLWLIDYGYSATEYYHPERVNGSLMCFQNGKKHENPLLSPGNCDITAHVNWSKMADVIRKNGLSIYGYTSQAMFMQSCLMHQSSYHDIDMLKILMYPDGMGETVKVLMCGTQGHQAPLGSAHKLMLEYMHTH